jgi:hypothetical protein
VGKIAPDHVFDDMIDGKIFRVIGTDKPAVPHDGNLVRNGKYFFNFMGDINNGYALIAQPLMI